MSYREKREGVRSEKSDLRRKSAETRTGQGDVSRQAGGQKPNRRRLKTFNIDNQGETETGWCWLR